MDTRRLNTGEVLAAGILGTRCPDGGVPENRETVTVGVNDPPTTAQRHLESGCVVECPEYYGIPVIWREDDGSYRGVLFQYRDVTEDHRFDSALAAMNWFLETSRVVSG